MTVDRFVEDRRARWARLGNLIFEANGRVERLAPAEARQHLAERRLWTDIPEGYRPLLGPIIIVNNVRVAIAAFAGGLTAGALTLYLLIENGAFLGTVLAVVQGYGLSGGLLAFTAAHGPLELSCIVLSGGAGLRLAWALLRPGERSRRDALRLAGAQAIRVMLLVIPALGIAGILEAFLSPSEAPLAVKITAGAIAALVLWGYIALAGRSF